MLFKKILTCLIVTALLLNLSCATKGLVSEKYDESFYRVKKLLPDTKFEENEPFIVISDNQAAFRGYHMALSKDRWTSPWMLAVPFYQLYLLGNGAVGVLNFLRHKPDYGHNNRLMVRDAIYEAAGQTDAAFILDIGDIAAHDGRRPEHWKMFLDDYHADHPILKEIPFLPVIGNHDSANDTTYGWPNYHAIFGYPRFYTVEFPDGVIFILDSNFIIDQRDKLDDDYQDELFSKWFVSQDSANKSWLENRLAQYKDKSFKIVAMHHPLFSFNKHHHDWYDPGNGNTLLEKRKKLVDLFERYEIQLVLSGHDHLYQHNLLKYDNHEMHFIVGGGGGGALRSLAKDDNISEYSKQFSDQGFDIVQLKQQKMYHYFEINFDKRRLKLDIYEVTGNNGNQPKLADRIVIDDDAIPEMNEVGK